MAIVTPHGAERKSLMQLSATDSQVWPWAPPAAHRRGGMGGLAAADRPDPSARRRITEDGPDQRPPTAVAAQAGPEIRGSVVCWAT